MDRNTQHISTLSQSKQMTAEVNILFMLGRMFVCSAPSPVDTESNRDLFNAIILV
jgi:hypothetical protein